VFLCEDVATITALGGKPFLSSPSREETADLILMSLTCRGRAERVLINRNLKILRADDVLFGALGLVVVPNAMDPAC
jgi:hypothetical protein